MHRAIAVWLIGQTWRASLATAVLGVMSLIGPSFFAVPAGAVPVLMVLARDARSGMQAMMAGSISVAAVLLASGQATSTVLLGVVLIFIAPFGLAVIAQRAGSLRFCFQVAVLTCVLLIVGIYVGMDNAVASWLKFMNEWMNIFIRQLNEMGVVADEKQIGALFAKTNWGTFVTECLLTVLCSLFLGCWWQSLAQAPGAFGKEFRHLRLGKTLGAAAVVIVVAAFAFDKFDVSLPVANALLWIATIALALQGLAAVHRLRADGRMGAPWLVATYVLLIAVAPLVVMILAGLGVADNWRRTV